MTREGRGRVARAKITLWVCGIITAYVLLVMLVMFTKSAWQYLALPLYGCRP